MASLPDIPQLALNFSRSKTFRSFIKDSSCIFQANATEGNVAQRFEGAKRGDPSRRAFTVSK